MNPRILFTIIFTAAFALTSCGQNQKMKTNLETELDSVSYAIGITFGHSLQESSGLETINPEAIAMGIQEAWDGVSELHPDEASMILNSYFTKLQFGPNLEEGELFLEDNLTKEGVSSTPSGLQYKVIEMGDGPKPGESDKVKVHYKGTLIDGRVFDSSYERGGPAEFVLNQIIPGWTEALQLMPVGSKWEIYIPQDLAYGANPRQGGMIEPYMPLIFEVELLEIIDDDE